MAMDLLSNTSLAHLDEAVKDWGVPDGWDVILVGDGAGSGWDVPCGWGVTLVDRLAKRRKSFYGGLSTGTINTAELMPYVQALSWLAENRARAAHNGHKVPPVCRVHVVTDHQAIATEGRALNSGLKTLRDLKANRAYWAALLSFEPDGFVLDYHWKPRASSALNCWADEMATICFKAIKEMPRPVDSLGRVVSIYECNPSGQGPTPLDELPRKADPKPRKKKPREKGCPDVDAE